MEIMNEMWITATFSSSTSTEPESEPEIEKEVALNSSEIETSDAVSSETEKDGAVSSSARRKIFLRSSDGVMFEEDEKVLRRSMTIKFIIDDCNADCTIPLPGIHSHIFRKVIEYCKHHVYPGATNMKAYKKNFIKDLIHNKEELIQVILAANFLNIPGLLNLSCKAVAKCMKTLSVEEIRRQFNIQKDLSEEEEDEIRSESPWVFGI